VVGVDPARDLFGVQRRLVVIDQRAPVMGEHARHPEGVEIRKAVHPLPGDERFDAHDDVSGAERG